jgi:hypothetical protein
MRNCLLAACVLVMLIAVPGLSGAVTFDDLPGSFGPIPAGYGGPTWTWNNFILRDQSTNNTPSGYVNGTVSWSKVAYNGSGDPASITSTSFFDFNGAYFTAAWNDDLQLQITAKNGNTVVGQNTWTLQTSGPLWIGPGWTNITELDFNSFGGTNHGYGGTGPHFVMDNFNGTAPVPIPGALFLFAPGLAGLAAIRRRFTK